MAEAKASIVGMVEVYDAMTPVEREAENMGGRLLDGMSKGLAVIDDVCESYLAIRREKTFEQMDPKHARMCIDAANGIVRLGSRVMDEAFRRRRDDHVGKLLEQLRQAEDEKKGA